MDQATQRQPASHPGVQRPRRVGRSTHPNSDQVLLVGGDALKAPLDAEGVLRSILLPEALSSAIKPVQHCAVLHGKTLWVMYEYMCSQQEVRFVHLAQETNRWQCSMHHQPHNRKSLQRHMLNSTLLSTLRQRGMLLCRLLGLLGRAESAEVLLLLHLQLPPYRRAAR